ncbi:MAG: iron uptake porin [Cyanobacteria bacterium P01_A01_bin.37]
MPASAFTWCTTNHIRYTVSVLRVAIATALLWSFNPASTEAATHDDPPMASLTSVSELSDVQTTDWAFQALQSLIERYECISGDRNELYRGDRSLTRLEFAVSLNECLNQINGQLQDNALSQTDLATLHRLQTEFATDVSALRDQVTTLESRAETLEAQQFSTTTRLNGEVVFALSGAFGNNRAVSNRNVGISQDEVDDTIVFGNRTRLFLNSSFNGNDQLRVRLQVGNVSNFGSATGTNMARLGFDSNTQDDVVLTQLHYRFPVGQSAEVTLMANGTLFDVADTINPLLGSDGRGSVSVFGLRSPIYREEIGATGAGISYDIDPAINLSFVYLAGDANEPMPGSGLFNGSYTALSQLTLRPTSTFTVGLTYTRSLNAIGIGTSSAIANDPFNNESNSITGNSYGLQTSWLVTSKLRIGGWVGFVDVTAKDLEDTPNAEIFYYAVTLALPDVGGEGNLAGFVFGQPPRVVRNQFGLSDPDTSLHLEGFYRIQINDNLAITPGVFAILNPEHNSQNDAIVVGTVRTVFSF